MELLDQLDPKVAELTTAVEQEALQRPEVLRLMTHPGVGAITGLVYVLVIGTLERFPGGKQIDSYTEAPPRWHLGHFEVEDEDDEPLSPDPDLPQEPDSRPHTAPFRNLTSQVLHSIKGTEL